MGLGILYGSVLYTVLGVQVLESPETTWTRSKNRRIPLFFEHFCGISLFIFWGHSADVDFEEYR